MESSQDQQLQCIDCNTSFVFTVSEQEFFKLQNFTPPKRCKNCRMKRKAEKNTGRY